MTNLQLLQYLIGSNASLSQERLLIAAELEGVNPEGTYDTSLKCLIYKIALREISQAKGIKEEAEGGYKISYVDSNVPGILSALAQESGCQDLIDLYDTAPKVRNASKYW